MRLSYVLDKVVCGLFVLWLALFAESDAQFFVLWVRSRWLACLARIPALIFGVVVRLLSRVAETLFRVLEQILFQLCVELGQGLRALRGDMWPLAGFRAGMVVVIEIALHNQQKNQQRVQLELVKLDGSDICLLLVLVEAEESIFHDRIACEIDDPIYLQRERGSLVRLPVLNG